MSFSFLFFVSLLLVLTLQLFSQTLRIIVFIIMLAYVSLLIAVHLWKTIGKKFNFLPDEVKDLLLISNKDSSKKKAILFLILLIIAVYNLLMSLFTSTLTSNKENMVSMIMNILKHRISDFLLTANSSVIFIWVSTFFLGKFIEQLYKLRDGEDPNTGERNVIIRARTFYQLLSDRDNEDIENIGSKVGKEFARKFRNRREIRNLQDIEKEWKKTDVDIALFFEDIKIKDREGDEIEIELYEPFWRELLRENGLVENNGNFNERLPQICNFFKHYAIGILEEFEESTGKRPIEAKYKCEEKGRCFLVKNRKKFCRIIINYEDLN